MTSTEWKEEERFPTRVSAVKVPAFLRNYTKAANRRIEEYNDAQFTPHSAVTVHGKSWTGKPGENLPVIQMPCSPVRTHVYEGVYAKTKAPESTADRVDKRDALTGADRSAVCTSNATETRASLSRVNTGITQEPMESQPFTAMFCAGQRLEGQSAKKYAGDAKKEISATRQECSTRNHAIPSERRRVSANGTAYANPTQTLALNKLYSSLKRMKSRRGETCMEDSATVASVNATDSSFNRSFLNKILGVRRGSWSERSEREEIYILLGGKSKPVRLQFKTDGLHLVSENEWGVDLKSREDLVFSKMDQESRALLEKFRERYRPKGRSPESIDKKLIRNSQFPWARHVVYKGGLYEEKHEILEKDNGSKLSIHVYLPNAGGMGDEGSECSHR